MEISVIVPVYKAEPYLRRCVDSILNQTFTDFELILVDDGSPDNCGAICDEYARRDPRVKVIHQENSGVSAARNAGIDWTFTNSDSQWLSFVDSDDWIHPQMLEALLISAEKTSLPVSAVSFQRVNSQNDTDCQAWEPEKIEVVDTEDFFCEKNVEAIVPWNKLYRRILFRNLRYPMEKIHEEEFLTYRIIFQTEQIAYVPGPMYWYFQNTSGITHSKWNIKKLDKVQALREQIDWFDKNGYKLAHRARITTYAWYVGECIRELSESDMPDKAVHIRRLKRQLRSLLREKRNLLSPNDIKVKWIFQIAYPTEMKIRRFFQRILNRFWVFGR